MSRISVNFGKTTGRIKPMHGVGQPPFEGVEFSMFQYLKDAGIPFSRLHDVGDWYGHNIWVDIPNLFRDFDADVNDPASYDFAFTDLMITALIENGVEPFFRLGVSIENAHDVKAYRIFPPKDNQKWAEICEHVIRHYTEGWANGFCYKIRYWEIWNEPDGDDDLAKHAMWKGSKEDYFKLYAVAATHLKKCFPHLKIGGYASCGFYDILKNYVKEANSSSRTEYFITFFHEFLDYIKPRNIPFDFFSWHSYDSIYANLIYQDYAKKQLATAGYPDIEIFLNEWNYRIDLRGTAEHAALTAGMMLALQDSTLDGAMFYDARLSSNIYGSMFNPLTHKPLPTYYAFTAFNRLYQLQNEAAVKNDMENVYTVAAVKEKKGCIMISNTTAENIKVDLLFDGKIEQCLITKEGRNDESFSFDGFLPKHSILTIEVSL